MNHESVLDCGEHLIRPLEDLMSEHTINKVLIDFSQVNFLGMQQSKSLYRAVRALNLLGQSIELKNVTPRVSLSLSRWSPEIITEGLVTIERA